MDHDGKHHKIYLKPGEMASAPKLKRRTMDWLTQVWYESASLVHARSKPLNGSAFENLFVHYMPRAKLWYKTDWNVKFGRPDPHIT